MFLIGATGFVPVVSDIMGANTPRDLGVKSTNEDYKNALAKIGFELDNSLGFGKDTMISYGAGRREVDITLTNAEISSLINFKHAEAYPVRNAQVKISQDGTMEASALVVVPEYKGYSLKNAVYAKGKVEVLGSKSVNLVPEAAAIGYVPVPIDPKMVDFVETEVNGKLSSIPGLEIESISYQDGGINFKGTIPASAKRVPRVN